MSRHYVRVFTDNPVITEEAIKRIGEKCGMYFPQVHNNVLTVNMYCTDRTADELKHNLLDAISPRLFVVV